MEAGAEATLFDRPFTGEDDADCARPGHFFGLLALGGAPTSSRVGYVRSSNRSTPGAVGFFTLIHAFDGRDR